MPLKLSTLQMPSTSLVISSVSIVAALYDDPVQLETHKYHKHTNTHTHKHAREIISNGNESGKRSETRWRDDIILLCDVALRPPDDVQFVTLRTLQLSATAAETRIGTTRVEHGLLAGTRTKGDKPSGENNSNNNDDSDNY